MRFRLAIWVAAVAMKSGSIALFCWIQNSMLLRYSVSFSHFLSEMPLMTVMLQSETIHSQRAREKRQVPQRPLSALVMVFAPSRI
jgi:hypothetical protein